MLDDCGPRVQVQWKRREVWGAPVLVLTIHILTYQQYANQARLSRTSFVLNPRYGKYGKNARSYFLGGFGYGSQIGKFSLILVNGVWFSSIVVRLGEIRPYYYFQICPQVLSPVGNAANIRRISQSDVHYSLPTANQKSHYFLTSVASQRLATSHVIAGIANHKWWTNQAHDN